MTIGEKLEEARKRKGVSIREAAEATKIRGDFLLSLESNTLDIPLPEIYIRGFLKNYARFLRLDADRIMTDYDATRLGNVAITTAETRGREPAAVQERESLGRMDLSKHNEPANPVEPALPPPQAEDFSALGPSIRERFQDSEFRALYLKLALLLVGALSLIVLIAIMVSLLRTGDADSPRVAAETREAAPAGNVAREERSPAATASSDEIRLIALDNVTVIVDETRTNRRLFSGTLEAGESRTLERSGPVQIRFTDGNALEVEKDGRRFKMGSAGVGYTRLD